MIVKRMLVSCKKATEMMEKQELIGLSVIESFNLVIHTSMCTACKTYRKQLTIMNKLISNYIKSEIGEEILHQENPEFKTRLIQSIK